MERFNKKEKKEEESKRTKKKSVFMSEEYVLYRYTLQIRVILIHLSVLNREVTFCIFERVLAYASKKCMCTRNRYNNQNIN